MVGNKTLIYCAVILATMYLTSVAGEETAGEEVPQAPFQGVMNCNFTEEALREHCPGYTGTHPGQGNKWSVGLTYNHGR